MCVCVCVWWVVVHDSGVLLCHGVEQIGKHMRRRRVPKSKEEIAFLKEVLRRHPLFEAMPPERLHKVLPVMLLLLLLSCCCCCWLV